MLIQANGSALARADRILIEHADRARLEQAVRSGAFYSKVKRACDVSLVLLAAPAVLMVVALAALLVLALMGRPILFMQNRVGMHGRVFRIFKLRTMRPSPSGVTMATAKNDQRITPLGRFLRLSHIDELPQLWNVVTGDMALIGPRPEQPDLVAYYRQVIPNYELRHTVRPGLSGWAQVCYGYAASVEETRHKLEYDLFYIQNFGPKIDVHVLALTFLRYANPKYVR